MHLLPCLLAIVLCLITASYAYLKWHYGFWARRGIPHEKPHLVWGNLKGVGKTISLGAKLASLYSKYRGETKLCGVFMMVKPMALICDLDLIKTVLIKDFHKFSDRGTYVNEKNDPLSANLFNLPEEPWKFLRSKLSPTFSSGKLKMMTPIVAQLGEKLLYKLQESHGTSMNAGKMFARYTTDVIGNCAFGLDCNSLDDPTSELVFRPTSDGNAKRTLTMIFGRMAKRLGIVLHKSEVNKFFYNVARQSVEYREREDVPKREDFLNSLLQMKANKELTFDQVAAQMYVFQLAGYETSSTTLTYVAYELALNADIQEKVREEVTRVVERHGKEVSYEAIFDMPYLDCVVNEALRKYSPARMLTRRVTVDQYQLPGTEIHLKRDDLVALSITGIHYDPLIYPCPDLFDPDRFLPEQVKLRHPMSFLPFGEGNRNCIGLRFALMEIKMALAKILLRFRLERGDDLPDKLEFLPRGMILTPSCDINIRFKEL